MIKSKVMIGKDVINRLNFEQYYNDCKSVLVVFDLEGDICGAKWKIKKSLPKELNVTYFRLKSSSFVELSEINKCKEIVAEKQIDLVICVGGDVAQNAGKMIKYFTTCSDNNAVNEGCVLISIPVASGNHHQLLSGYFEVVESKENTFYRYNKDVAIPNVVMVEEKMLDKLGIIAKLGIELSTQLMSLIALPNRKNDNEISALSALDIISKNTLSLCDLVSAEMYAGAEYLSIKGNILDECISGIQRITKSSYSLILLLTLRKNIAQIVDMLSNQDIKNIAINFNCDETIWKEEYCKQLNEKIDRYFEDKDIPKVLNEIGLNSEDIEAIFSELECSFGGSEMLSRLKDIVYSNY